MVHYPPNPICRDIPDPSETNRNSGLDCKAFHEKMIGTADMARRMIKDDIKMEIEETDTGKNHGHRFVLSEIVASVKDTLSVIRLIHKTFYEENKTELICALPLARTIIESVFTVAILLRKPKEYFPKYEKVAYAKDYYRFIYQHEETKNILRCKVINDEQYKLRRQQLLGKTDASPEDVFTEQELIDIESAARNGVGIDYRFPTPMGVLKLLDNSTTHLDILSILKRIYVEYQWLCGYTHGDGNSVSMRAALELDHPDMNKAALKEKEIVEPVIAISFLASLIILTDVSSYLNNSEELVVCLSKDWDFFEKNSLLGIFIWDNWARKALRLLSL